MLYDAQKYGYAVTYALKIAGFPYLFTEITQSTATSEILFYGTEAVQFDTSAARPVPAGYTERRSLAVDRAVIGVEQIDREQGLAVSLPLSFKLLDSSDTNPVLRRYTNVTNLTNNVAPGDTTLYVASTAGFPSSGYIHLGLECISYTGKTGTAFTGCSRAQLGTMKYLHKVGTAGQRVTDQPRYLRGRDVWLMAMPATGLGRAAPGSSWTSDSHYVFVGRISENPQRERDGFRFEALPLDRLLDLPLAASFTGKIVQTTNKVAVWSGAHIHFAIAGYKNNGTAEYTYGLTLTPFSADTDGDLLSPSEVKQRVVDAWASAVTAAGAGADLGSMKWVQNGSQVGAEIEFLTDINVVKITLVMQAFIHPQGISAQYAKDIYHDQAGLLTNHYFPSFIWGNIYDPLSFEDYAGGVAGGLQACTVQLDEGDASSVPAFGTVDIDSGSIKARYSYAFAGTSGGALYLAGMLPLNGVKLFPSNANGATVTFALEDEGKVKDVLLRTLCSSGTGARGTYDTLAQGAGLGIEEQHIDLVSTNLLPDLWIKVDKAGKKPSELFAGILGLNRLALVHAPATTGTSSPQLRIVRVSPAGALTSGTSPVTHFDLAGHSQDPVEVPTAAPTPNVIRLIQTLGSEDGNTWTSRDNSSIEAFGAVEMEYSIPAPDSDVLDAMFHTMAPQTLAMDLGSQPLTLRVPGWIRAEVGDIIDLAIYHPALYNYATGDVGTVERLARVVGRKQELSGQIATLTVIVSGYLQGYALSPSMQVLGFDSATAPTWIDVPAKYLDFCTSALASDQYNTWVMHYRKGQAEATGQRHQFTTVSTVGGLTRLAITANFGGHTLNLTDSYLTLHPRLDARNNDYVNDNFSFFGHDAWV